MSSTSPAAAFAAQISEPRSRSTRMTQREKLEGRLDAAKVNGGASAATPRGKDRYIVEGRSGARYTVQVFSLEKMTCDCNAGLHGNPCWHAAATFLRILADRAISA